MECPSYKLGFVSRLRPQSAVKQVLRMVGDGRAHALTQHLSTWLEIMVGKVFSNSRVNVFSNTLKLHTIAHTAVRGRPTLKDVERFRNGSNLTRDCTNFTRDQFMSEQF